VAKISEHFGFTMNEAKGVFDLATRELVVRQDDDPIVVAADPRPVPNTETAEPSDAPDAKT
jgi:hypothetical protein